MGLFDKIAKIVDLAEKVQSYVEETENGKAVGTAENAKAAQKAQVEDIILAASSHTVEDEAYGDGDSRYRVTFQLNDAFKQAKSHAGEVEMLNTYAPEAEYGSEGALPCVAIMSDDSVYCAVEEFKEKGTIEGGTEVTVLSGKFYFKAKKEYYGDMMYFYGLDRCDGYWENQGLCIVYPKAYVGTENERKMMKVLDEAADSYREERTV